MAIKNRNKLHSIWKRKQTKSNWESFKAARNVTTLTVRNAKKTYYSNRLSSSLPSKQLWANLKHLGVCNKDNSVCNVCPEIMNQYFVSNSVAGVITAENLCYSSQAGESFSFACVSPAEVVQATKCIKSNAVGVDDIPIKFIKLILPYILGTLLHIINHCFTSNCFPNIWKVAIVIPLPKKSGASEPGDFRPISILPAFSKIMESIMAEQIKNFVYEKNFLSPYQSGFRSGHSCSTTMLKVLDDIRTPYDRGDLTILCMLDFSKAFDCVDHWLLCKKLTNKFGFGSHAVTLLISYLSGRSQKVRIGEKYSSLCSLVSGVPQGSLLGPLLFSMFLNDIFEVTNHVRMHGYADDIQVYLSCPLEDVNDLYARVNEDLQAISRWAHDNLLTLNPTKCLTLPISRRRIQIKDFPLLNIMNTPLKTVEKARNLGFIVNTHLTCTDHVNHILSKVYLILRRLRLSSDYLLVDLRRNLVLQLILPHFTYSQLVYSKLDSLSLHKMEVAFNSATRFVYGLKRYDHITKWRSLILGCSIEQFIEANNCIFLYRLMVKKCPMYLYEKLRFAQSVRSRTLIVPVFKHLNSSRFFFINAVRIWNSLPLSVKCSLSDRNVKQVLLEYFSV